jgi:hypothetical protein
MKTYYYVHTGHRIGLDRFRRAAAILKTLNDDSITLLTSDYRIASVAREYGVKNCVGLDVVRNIPQIAHNGDQLIFDSQEANPIMLEDMRNYFSTFIRMSDTKDESIASNELVISPYVTDSAATCHAYLVDEDFYNYDGAKDIALTYFFGDDDYEKDLEKHLDFIDGLDVHLQLGFYYFLDYEAMLIKKFPKHSEFDDYQETIKRSAILITASPQAVLESMACGGKPIYFQREDYTRDFIELFESLGVPIVENYDKKFLCDLIQNLDANKYHEIEHFSNKMSKFIKQSLNL